MNLNIYQLTKTATCLSIKDQPGIIECYQHSGGEVTQEHSATSYKWRLFSSWREARSCLITVIVNLAGHWTIDVHLRVSLYNWRTLAGSHCTIDVHLRGLVTWQAFTCLVLRKECPVLFDHQSLALDVNAHHQNVLFDLRILYDHQNAL